jgi:hypothetical protein
MVKALEDVFPGLRGTSFRVTSPADDSYNCVAWAAGATNTWWWPFGDPASIYWPENAARLETVAAFRVAFASLGYTVCEHHELEAGHEKIALFADAEGEPTHVARQLPSSRWTSKLGKSEDIEHGLLELEGAAYGSVVLIMKRSLPPQEREAAPEQAN